MAQAMRQYLKEQQVETRYIEPGGPGPNAYVKSFNSKLRDELLDRELCTTILEAQVLAEQFRNFYNYDSPHSGINKQTPAAFAASYTNDVNPELALTGT
jgi:transposase InsO family protein